jgi:large conductance mechanosensitive channel
VKGFRDFILRGNVIDLAVAVVIGAIFTAVVTSLVTDLINPLLAATVGKPNFGYLILNVHGGQVKYGNFINAVIAFVLNATAVYFFIVLPFNALMKRVKPPVAEVAPATRTCPECLSQIPAAARRCFECGQPVGAAA